MNNSIALRENQRHGFGRARNPASTDKTGNAQDRREWDLSADLDKRIDAACERIAPLWPLKHFVAVNPFFGLRDLPFQQASDTLARVAGSKLYMDWSYYREQIADGHISRRDIEQAIAAAAVTWT